MARGVTPPELQDLYDRNAPAVFRRALRLLGREADAWDVVQEVFMKLLEAPDAFRGEARPMTYLYRVTTNLCLNHLRGQRVRQPGSDEDAAAVEPFADDVASATESRELLRKLAGKVHDRVLSVAALQFVDGLPQEEIAEVLGVTRKTVGRDLAKLRVAAVELSVALPSIEELG